MALSETTTPSMGVMLALLRVTPPRTCTNARVRPAVPVKRGPAMKERTDRSSPPSAVPGLDGIGLLRKLRSLSPERGGQIPAAAVSAGRATDLDRAGWRAAGFQRHLEKPFEAEAVAAVLEELAGHFVERRVSSLERREWPTPHDRRAERRTEPTTLARVVAGDSGRLELADRELR